MNADEEFKTVYFPSCYRANPVAEDDGETNDAIYQTEIIAEEVKNHSQ